MTQKSYVWDGTITGDSSLAPYNSNEFNAYMHSQLQGSSVYVMPGYLNSLEPHYSIDSPYSLNINTGAALIKNFLYHQTDPVVLGFSPVSAGYYRVDRVVLQVDWSAYTVRLVVKEGTEQTAIYGYYGAGQTISPLTQTEGYIWEEDLFQILLDGDELVSGITDLRSFLVVQPPLSSCLVRNSEFLAIARYFIYDGFFLWAGNGIDTLSAGGKLTQQARGFTIALDANETMYQEVPLTKGSNKTITARCLYSSSSGITLRLRGVLSGGGYTDWYDSIGFGYGQYVTQLTHTFPEEITAVQVMVKNTVSGGTQYAGQVQVTEQFNLPENQLSLNELLATLHPLNDAAWALTAKSTGNTTIDLTTSFGGSVSVGTKAVIVVLIANDSGSAGGGCQFGVTGGINTGLVLLSNVPNDYHRSITTLVPVSREIWNTSSDVPQFVAEVFATGAGTLDATIYISGVLT